MTPATLLWTLRERGYAVELCGVDLVIRRGSAPPNETRAIDQLRAAKPELVALLETEAHPTVRRVRDVFPATRLVSITTSAGKEIT